MAQSINPGIDPLFGVHADALALRSRRLELIASNLANADTPGYKAKDLDFNAALAQALANAQAPGTLAQSNAAHLPAAALPNTVAPGEPVILRAIRQPSLDGNTVDAQQEHAAFAQAALEYQASLTFLEGRMKTLMTAITGQ